MVDSYAPMFTADMKPGRLHWTSLTNEYAPECIAFSTYGQVQSSFSLIKARRVLETDASLDPALTVFLHGSWTSTFFSQRGRRPTTSHACTSPSGDNDDGPEGVTERELQTRLAHFWRLAAPCPGAEYDVLAAEERYNQVYREV
jgi:hypothetical protein